MSVLKTANVNKKEFFFAFAVIAIDIVFKCIIYLNTLHSSLHLLIDFL